MVMIFLLSGLVWSDLYGPLSGHDARGHLGQPLAMHQGGSSLGCGRLDLEPDGQIVWDGDQGVVPNHAEVAAIERPRERKPDPPRGALALWHVVGIKCNLPRHAAHGEIAHDPVVAR